MPSSVDDQVLDFYARLFDLIFSEPFRGRISELRKLKPVIRQVEVAADAASSSSTRFFLNQKLSEATVEDILRGFAAIGELLEHIRYRTGLLLERRPGIFGFAHLTFQEYLAARAVHEGNQLGVDKEQLVQEHDDGRWKEVIALYSGLATKPAVRDLIEQLIAQPDTEPLSGVLTEVYFSAGLELAQDKDLRRQVLERVAIAPADSSLDRFPQEEVAPIANRLVGNIKSNIKVSEAYIWLYDHPELLSVDILTLRLYTWQSITPFQLSELVYLLHKYAPDEVLTEIAKNPDLYNSVGPTFKDGATYYTQAEVALMSLSDRNFSQALILEGFQAVVRIIISLFCSSNSLSEAVSISFERFLRTTPTEVLIPQNLQTKQEFALLVRKLATHLKRVKMEEGPIPVREGAIKALNNWVNLLEGVKPEEKTSRKSASVKTQTNKPKPRKR